MVPFDMLGMVSYWCSVVTLSYDAPFFDIRLLTIPLYWNPDYESLRVIGTHTDRSATYDFILIFHRNHGPISYRFRDRRRFQSKIAKIGNAHARYQLPRDL